MLAVAQTPDGSVASSATSSACKRDITISSSRRSPTHLTGHETHSQPQTELTLEAQQVFVTDFRCAGSTRQFGEFVWA